MKITIYDIAEQAGVSIATVSKVINNKGRISNETRMHVLNVMKELNYKPNLIASALTGKHTYTLGVLIPDLANPFFAELARSIEDHARELNYNVVICNTDYRHTKEKEYIDLLIQKRVDGFILASGFEDASPIEQLTKINIPVVIVARELPSFSVMSVATDDYTGGYIAAKHLNDQNHQKIGILGRDLWTNRERIRGFNDYLIENNIPIQEDFQYISGIDHINEAIKETNRLLHSNAEMTAIFACNDLLAAGALRAAKDMGYQLPKDLAVVGYDGTSITRIVQPTLTSVAQPIEKMGEQSVQLMLEKIENKHKKNKNIKLEVEVIQGQST